MSIYLPVKKLVYKELQPFAKAANCQLLILDAYTYRYSSDLGNKLKRLGINPDEYKELETQLEYWRCVAILKSKTYYGASEIASFFSKLGLEKSDVHYLSSVEAPKHPIWGDFDATIPPNKRKFFYWFRVHVENENGENVMENEGNWKVDFIDDEDGENTASFDSRNAAEKWITNKDTQERYDPTGFEVVKGPYEDNN